MGSSTGKGTYFNVMNEKGLKMEAEQWKVFWRISPYLLKMLPGDYFFLSLTFFSVGVLFIYFFSFFLLWYQLKSLYKCPWFSIKLIFFFVCIFFGVMTGGLKNFFFLQVYIYLTLFKIYVCVWKTSASHSFSSVCIETSSSG